MLEGEGQVSVCQGVGYLLSAFPSATKNSCTWLTEEQFYIHLHAKHLFFSFFFFAFDVRLHLWASRQDRHQAAPAGLALPVPHCLTEEEGRGGMQMVNVVLAGGATA